jgi:hypothetical protein
MHHYEFIILVSQHFLALFFIRFFAQSVDKKTVPSFIFVKIFLISENFTNLCEVKKKKQKIKLLYKND